MLKLYDYWRSSAAYRVRIALNLKGVPYTSVPVDLRPGVSEQRDPDYAVRNPQMRVPAIRSDARVSGQSLAILEWLEEKHPAPSILPDAPWERLQARAFADTIGCDIHPLNNLSVLGALKDRFGADEAAIADWYRHWIIEGFTALEAIAQKRPHSRFLFGLAPTVAEICLVPQMYNARRFEVDLTAFPRLAEVDAEACELEAFRLAGPENQAKATSAT